MQRILRTLPKVFIQPTNAWTFVPSRSFARGKKPTNDPNKARDAHIEKLVRAIFYIFMNCIVERS